MSRREAEVVALVARGWTHRRIANSLGISLWTVAHHWRRAKAKAGIESRDQVIARGMTQAT